MRINVSQVLEYQLCPRRWKNKYVHGRTVPPGDALGDGLYWHKLAECWLSGKSLLPQANSPAQDRMRQFVEEGNLPRLPVVGVEVRLEMPLGKHTLVGTLDGIQRAELRPAPPPLRSMQQWYDSLQWKTCAGSVDLERQTEAVRVSYHECAYEALMNHNGYPCRGTYLGIWQKPTKGDIEAGVVPLHWRVVERDPAYVQEVLGELEEWADKMESDTRLLPNRRNCVQGWYTCQYFPVCYEGAGLADLRYSDHTDPYTEEQSDA